MTRPRASDGGDPERRAAAQRINDCAHEWRSALSFGIPAGRVALLCAWCGVLITRDKGGKRWVWRVKDAD